MWVLAPGSTLCLLREVAEPLGLLVPHCWNERVGPDKLKGYTEATQFHKWEMGRMYFTHGKPEVQRSGEVR